MQNGWRQRHAQLGFEHWVLDEPPWPKTVEFCDLLGTAYAPVSKIPSVKFISIFLILTTWNSISLSFLIYVSTNKVTWYMMGFGSWEANGTHVYYFYINSLRLVMQRTAQSGPYSFFKTESFSATFILVNELIQWYFDLFSKRKLMWIFKETEVVQSNFGE